MLKTLFFLVSGKNKNNLRPASCSQLSNARGLQRPSPSPLTFTVCVSHCDSIVIPLQCRVSRVCRCHWQVPREVWLHIFSFLRTTDWDGSGYGSLDTILTHHRGGISYAAPTRSKIALNRS